jgi:hypothetical protein
MKSFFQIDLIIVNNYELGGGKLARPVLSCKDITFHKQI